MFRRWLSAFWRRNKEKIKQFSKLIGVLVLISAVASMIFSNLNTTDNNTQNVATIYNPSETVISGSNISEKEYEEDDNLVKQFVDYCNEQKIEEAYNLLTDECKQKMYPTLEDFENAYYRNIFTQRREYNLQSWINVNGYNTYKVRFIEDIMSTGVYDNTEKFEDYITIVADENNEQNEKLNINGYIKTEEISEKTQTEELEIDVLNCDIYMNYIIYRVSIKNKTSNEIALDTLSNNDSIKLLGTNEAGYKLNSTNLKTIDLQLVANGRKNIELKFSKQYGSDVKGDTIQFKKVITNYSEYKQNQQNYTEYKELKIRL